MKRTLLYSCCLLLCFMSVSAQVSDDRAVEVSNLHVERHEETLFISMEIEASALQFRTEHEVVLTPMLVSETESATLPAVHIVGHNRYFRYLRNDKGEDLRNIYRTGEKKTIPYRVDVPFAEWMEKAELMMEDSRCGCQNKVLTENKELLSDLDFAPKVFTPLFVYLSPAISLKNREVKGSAYVDFPVGQARIDKNYRDNEMELQKIFATIDSIKEDPDVRIVSVSIKGFASPDGPYELNKRLAMERTKVLAQYIQALYTFPSGTVHSGYEAEDWEGLKEYVENSSLPHKTEILDLISDEKLTPDGKDWRIKTSYPKDYRYLLLNCYPALRHSDYAVEYLIRAYTDVEEAKRVMRERPGNLSLYEYYMVAGSYAEGSEEYNDVFDTMVRLYPDDETANLNAANVAMVRGDMISAHKFLAKAGKSGKAKYARGVFAALGKDYATARQYFIEAEKAGVEEAAEAMKQLDELEK